jgi:glutathione S-transferase
MLCEEKAVAYELVRAVPHSPEINAIAPTGFIPAMRHGAVELFESRAIAGYIDVVFPGPNLFPSEPVAAAVAEQWISYGNGRVDRFIMREFVVPQVFPGKDKAPDMERVNRAVPEIERVLGVLNQRLSASPYLAGDVMTFADLNVTPMIWAFHANPMGREILRKYPAVSAYYVKMSARPSFVATTPPPRKAG